MKKAVGQNLKLSKALSLLTVIMGVILLVYMIVFEDEPGALPLFLVVTGIVWFIVNQYRIKKQLH